MRKKAQTQKHKNCELEERIFMLALISVCCWLQKLRSPEPFSNGAPFRKKCACLSDDIFHVSCGVVSVQAAAVSCANRYLCRVWSHMMSILR